MRAKLGLIVGICATALLLTGCPPKDGECSSTDDCKGQEKFASDVCVDKHCEQCGADTDCKAGFVCANKQCQPKPECSTAADCGIGKLCQNQKCVAGCTNDSGCGGGKCVAGQCKAATGSCNSSADCPPGQSCQNGYCSAPTMAEAGTCQLRRINFGFNESTLDGTAEGTLKDDADCIQKRKLAVTLEGNADERGTEEYNLHLGERRAASAKKYLQTLGVDAKKMKTISYGNQRPANPGHDEAAWAENRRVDVVEK
jgi:peptidoglycan-associated lipoprotein